MKKITTIILSVLLIALTFVSCDNATKAVQDELVEVTLSTQAIGRSLTVSNPLEALNNIDWYYTAEKLTECQFNYGATSTQKYINLFGENNENRLTLSQGKWKFELFGYAKQENPPVNPAEGASVLYYGVVDEALILRDNGINQITVEVSPYTDAIGSILFSNVTLTKASNTSFYPNYIKVCKVGSNTASYESAKGENNKYPEYTTNHTVENLSAGQYEVTVAWKETITDDNPDTQVIEDVNNPWDLVIASETIYVTVYGGRTTTISGNISEETGSGTINGNIEIKTEATQTKTVLPNTPTTFTVNVAPANSVSSSKVENTTVTFEENKLTGSNTLNISVKDVAKASVDSSFSVTDGETPVAGIDITLANDQGDVTGNFGTVTIETYIAPNLSNVKVYFGGSVIAADSEANDIYDSVSGKLKFTTNHFSEYYVGATGIVAINLNRSTIHSSIEEAIAQSQPNDRIKICSDVTVNNTINVSKSLTFDLSNNKLTLNADFKIGNSSSSPAIAILNGTVESQNNKIESSNGCSLMLNNVKIKNTSGVLRQFIVIKGSELETTNTFLTNDCTFVNACIDITPLSKGGTYNVEIKNCKLSATEISATSSDRSNIIYVHGNVKGVIKIEGTILKMEYTNKAFTTYYPIFINSFKSLEVDFISNTFDLSGFALPYNFDPTHEVNLEFKDEGNVIKIDDNAVELERYSDTKVWITKGAGESYDKSKEFFDEKITKTDRNYYLVEYRDEELVEYYVGQGNSFSSLNKISKDESGNISKVEIRGKNTTAKSVGAQMGQSSDGIIKIFKLN